MGAAGSPAILQDVDNRRITRAALIDTLAIVVFVALGRRSHDEGSALSGTLAVAVPFLIAAVVGWVALRAWRNPEDPWAVGAPLAVVTVAVAMPLRRFVFDRGIALAFVIVASVFLGLFLIGWRVLVGWRAARTVAGAAR